ncbi:MAG TPA: endonuclease III [Bacillota bacterium]|nr:endonuclease III [Bacillota bacterium]HQE66668.1 endonuclease III [Bacillota bacterium]HQJ38398.1 endonuclease III [Bacillota bacterium]HQL36683.1 endonuclease III [Bacillota bacterium]
MRNIDDLKSRAKKISEILFKIYPEATCSLDYNKPLELLIATMLAAQCTDERVNIVTRDLFKKYTSVYNYANANPEELEEDIRPTGFYRNKARNIIGCCKKLIKDFGGKVPDNMEDLLSLPGVGRKTANVVLGNIYKIPGIIVDTHCKRLSNRIGLTEEEDPEKIEFDLMEILPREDWTAFSNSLVYHGRAICNARKPKCVHCPIAQYCDFFNNI